MGQTITSADMTLEQKLQAIADAIRALESTNTNTVLCGECV